MDVLLFLYCNCPGLPLKNMPDNYSTKKVSGKLKDELLQSIQSIKGWGSVEIFIQNYEVTQITEKKIKKTNHTGSV